MTNVVLLVLVMGLSLLTSLAGQFAIKRMHTVNKNLMTALDELRAAHAALGVQLNEVNKLQLMLVPRLARLERALPTVEEFANTIREKY